MFLQIFFILIISLISISLILFYFFQDNQKFLYISNFGWKVPFYRLKEKLFYGKKWREKVKGRLPNHIAIIMDGNRRYAKKLKLRNVAIGHEKGAEKLKEILKWFVDLREETSTLIINKKEEEEVVVVEDKCLKKEMNNNINSINTISNNSDNNNMKKKYCLNEITVWALSTDNLVKRSKTEISELWNLCEKNIPLLIDSNELEKQRVRIRIIGERDLLPKKLLKTIENVENRTKNFSKLTLNIALAYGGREEIKSLFLKYGNDLNQIDDKSYCLNPPDLIFRSGGEKRLSGFMMWQSKHSELFFSNSLWPSLDKIHLLDAFDDFVSRTRRFGK